jgi:diguanylate cyclase (GGDEF)-like protein
VRLVVPTQPVALVIGDAPEDGELLLRAEIFGGQLELWSSVSPAELPGDVLDEIDVQLQRIWRVQEDRTIRALEVDRLRFNLTALQQVARTLAVVRRTDETERLALDSIGEVFFSWWAALYRREDDRYVCRAVRALRGETVPDSLPLTVVRPVLPSGTEAVIPPPDAEIRKHIGAEIALIEALDLGDSSGLLFLGPRMTQAPYDAHDVALLRALADSSAIALRNAALLDRLRTQATVDPLTGCKNRRGFDELLSVEIARAGRHARPLALVFIDIDRFKAINDELGHDAGDHALRRLGQLLRTRFRASDSACRYGGEEFALILPETSKADAAGLAEWLRRQIEQMEPDEVVPRAFTASMGVAVFPDDAADAAELVRVADRALYQAKAQGRNQVCAA